MKKFNPEQAEAEREQYCTCGEKSILFIDHSPRCFYFGRESFKFWLLPKELRTPYPTIARVTQEAVTNGR